MRTKTAVLLTPLSLAISLLLALLWSLLLAPSPAHAASHQVAIQQYAYGPATLSVAVGDTVTWTNKDEARHDVVVTSGPVSFRSPLLSKGQSWSYTFRTAGSYSYTCSIHPDMRGGVTAKAAAPAPAPAPPKTHSAHPAPAASTSAPAATATAAAAEPSASAAAPTTTAAASAPASPATLNPLLLVAGVAIAVVVFCLLLIASRPPVPVGPDDHEDEG